MRFLVDENIRHEIILFLAAGGHDCKPVRKAADDASIIRSARDESRILLTHDRHFSNIIHYPPHQYRGIIRIKIDPPIVSELTAALTRLFSALTPEHIDHHLIILEKQGYRIR